MDTNMTAEEFIREFMKYPNIEINDNVMTEYVGTVVHKYAIPTVIKEMKKDNYCIKIRLYFNEEDHIILRKIHKSNKWYKVFKNKVTASLTAKGFNVGDFELEHTGFDEVDMLTFYIYWGSAINRVINDEEKDIEIVK